MALQTSSETINSLNNSQHESMVEFIIEEQVAAKQNYKFSHALLFFWIAGGSPPQPVVPTHKDKGGAPPVRSIYDELSSPGLGSTPLSSKRPVSVFSTGLFLAEDVRQLTASVNSQT